MNNRGQGAGCKREGNNSCNHEENCHYFFDHRYGGDIAVAHGDDGCDGEVEGGHVELPIRDVNNSLRVDPILLILIVEASNEDPKIFKLGAHSLVSGEYYLLTRNTS